MNANKQFQLALPNPNTSGELAQLESDGVVVVVGANGSGKTRLGTWIELESNQAPLVHRISAQKSLTMPAFSNSSSLEMAETNLLVGTFQANANFQQQLKQNYGDYKKGNRWGSNPNTFLLNDYQQLMVYLFTEENDKSTNYRRQSKQSQTWVEPPETKLDIVQRIWKHTLPHRELVISSGKVEARVKDVTKPTYNGAEMSDGERVIFYLIGQCLAAPQNGTIVIDEPELHLHRSIQGRLWDAIEAERADCLFVYLTHDLDFAATRVGAKKIWLRAYDGQRWDWCEIPETDVIPEDILLTILGGRKPVLFVEGTSGSLDSFLFSLLYPDFTIVPCRSCSDVIHATMSFETLKYLHSMECYGIVDLDNRTDEEVKKRESLGVFTLKVSEIENLLLMEDALRVIATDLHGSGIVFEIGDIETVIARIKEHVLQKLMDDKERLISKIVAGRIEDSRLAFNAKAQGKDELAQAFKQWTEAMDVPTIYDTVSAQIDSIVTNHDYDTAIKSYDNKGLVKEISKFFGMKADVFVGYLKRLAANKDKPVLLTALKKGIPSLSTKPSS